MRLSNKLLGQGYVKVSKKVLWYYGDLIKQYEVPLSRMVQDILEDEHIQLHPPLIRQYTSFDPVTDLDLTTEIDFLRCVHRTFATGAACQQRTLTPTDTWSCPTLGLACVLMYQSLLNLSCFRTSEFRTSLGTSVLPSITQRLRTDLGRPV